MAPILYRIYTIDIQNVTKNFTTIFADDTAVLVDLKEGTEKTTIENVLQRYENHFYSNKLKINTGKTEILTNLKAIKIVVNNTEITSSFKNSAKYLGITLTGNLKWSPHIKNVVQKMRAGTFALARVRTVGNKTVKLSILNSLINSHLQYGMHIWANNLRKYDMKNIETIHKAAVRICASQKKQTHSSPLYKMLNILKVPDLALTNLLGYYLRCKKLSNLHNELSIQLIENNRRSGCKFIAKHRGNHLNAVVKALNKIIPYLNLNVSDKSKIHKLKTHLIDKYKSSCDITNCFICSPARNYQQNPPPPRHQPP